MKTRIRATIKLWTMIVSVVFCTVVFQLWVIAFYNGDSVIVYINLYGEKWIELVLWIVAFPILAYGLLSMLGHQFREARLARMRYYRKIGKVRNL